MKVRDRLGNRIRFLRQRKGLTQADLSHAAAITRSHLSLIESGKLNAQLDTLVAICRALQIHPSEMFDTVRLEKEDLA